MFRLTGSSVLAAFFFAAFFVTFFVTIFAAFFFAIVPVSC